MNETPRFLLKEHSDDFVTRDIGRTLREALLSFEDQVPANERIVIDASGVSLMTPSFADEFFGRTAAARGLAFFKARFQVVGVEGDTKTLINHVVRNRLILDRASSSR